MSVRIKRLISIVSAIVLVAATVAFVLPNRPIYAANIEPRSLTLQPGASAGGSAPSGVVNHLFTFTLPSTTTIKSIQFQYCTNANIDIGGTCTTPHGLSTTSATLGTQSGYTWSSLVNTTNGAPYITDAAGITPSGTTAETVQLLSVTNPDGTDCGAVTNCTFFVRITSYSTATPNSADIVDAGTVAASVSTQIILTGTMPESLIFCTGGKVSENGNGIPDCTTATSGNITFGQLFSPTASTYATSQMAASTNANEGYAITVEGITLTSGSNTIHPIGGTPVTSASTVGTSDFGINLAADTDAATLTPPSADVTPADSTSGNLLGMPTANFLTGGANTVATYAFTAGSPNTIASSDYNGSPTVPGPTAGPTNAQIFTTTYMVNVSGSQPAGTYTTTLTYICTPTF